jgi:hypothetical protein
MFRSRGTVEAGGIDRGEVFQLPRRRRFEIRRDGEQVVEARRIQEGDLRSVATHRGLAHAVREQWRFTAQIAAHDEQRIELVDRGDRETAQAGRGGIGSLVAEIRLAQAVIDVRGTERARQLRE